MEINLEPVDHLLAEWRGKACGSGNRAKEDLEVRVREPKGSLVERAGSPPLNSLSQRRNPRRRRLAWVEAAAMIEVSRTLVKSEPELAELIESIDGVEVSMAEKGFGTRVEIRATPDSGLSEADLERLMDELAEPSRQPFTG
jgi:hypothetical protein